MASVPISDSETRSNVEGDSLVEGVEEEDERDDGVRGGLRAVQRVLRGADRLQREEERHARGGGEEEEAAAPAVDLERRKHGPEQVPDRQDTGDEQLDVGVGDADRVEHLVEVVRHEAVPGPLREPRDGDDDAHPLAVAARGD